MWDGRKGQLVDEMDMTPFHVLLSSVNPSSKLLAVLYDEYAEYALGWKDAVGNRSLDYSVGDWVSSSGSLIQCALQTWPVDRLLSWNRTSAMVQMSSQVDQILTEDDMERRDRFPSDLFVVMEGH
ncbi:MAG: hypothetical protein SGBAC_008613 [Bacillariaceae sp.]